MEQLSRPARRHRLTAAEFQLAAAGAVPPALIAKLRSVHASRTALLVKQLAQHRPELMPAAMALARAYDRDPVAVEPLLAHPWLGIWAAEQTRHGELECRPSYLPNAALAAMALTHTAGVPQRVAAYRGVLAVPGHGTRPSSRPDEELTPSDLTGPQWVVPPQIALRHEGLGWRLAVDDRDPHRDWFGAPPAGPLSVEAVSGLESSLAQAWQILTSYAPGFALELSAGIRLFVPLAQYGEGKHSITHSDGFGALAASPDLPGPDLAVTLVHEFQHSKLSALMILVRLADPGDTGRYVSPWRQDLRPIGGLFHGVYAFTAVAEVWHALRRHPQLGPRAAQQCDEISDQLQRGLAELTSAPSLTAAGTQWTALMRQRCAQLQTPVAAG